MAWSAVVDKDTEAVMGPLSAWLWSLMVTWAVSLFWMVPTPWLSVMSSREASATTSHYTLSLHDALPISYSTTLSSLTGTVMVLLVSPAAKVRVPEVVV